MLSLSKRSLTVVLSLIILGVIIFSPFIAGAQGYTFLDSTVIESGGCFSGGKIDFICYVQKIYTTVLVVVVVLSIFMIALGGLEYIASGAAGAKTEGKQRITHAIIGLLIALASYFILYTIDPSFVNFKLPLSPVSIASNPGTGPIRPGGGTGQPGGGVDHQEIPSGSFKYPSGVGVTEQDARNQLTKAGIGVNNINPCGGLTYQQYKARYGTSCTSLDGIPQESLDEIIALKKACSCIVQVNGATEPGHSSESDYGLHAPGYRAIDIDRSPDNIALDKYIEDNGVWIGGTAANPIYELLGRKYWKEDSAHWHSY